MSTTTTPIPKYRSWEVISDDPMEKTDRFLIADGFLYRTTVWASGAAGERAVATAMIFKPFGAIGSQSDFETPAVDPTSQPPTGQPGI
jgi:hypothetical protein